MKDLSRVTKCKLCGIKETAGNLTRSGECALRNDIPDNRIACKDRQIARWRHRYERLSSLANSLLNHMANDGEEGADVEGMYERVRVELNEPSEPGPEPEPVNAEEVR